MQRKKWLLRTGLALLIFIMVVAAKFMDKTHPITELYVFGDSLSDTGMVFRATGGMYPPNPTYFQGRYSNGRVWIEYLAESLHLSSKQTNNFAYGGSTTGSVGNSYVPSLLNQVQSFTQTHQKTNSDALYVLWAGANDYLQGVSSATIPVKNVTTAINSLTDVGAKKILVANLPDLGQLPATRNSANSVNLSALTQAHNQGLRRSLKVLSQQHSDLEIVQLDANTLYRDAIANPAAFNFTNVTSPCLSGSSICSNPDQFLFWDGIHPTAAAHRIIGETAFSTIKKAGMINPGLIMVP
ncbi:SGNH/GDSL hydrolase family protein [Nostoc sp. 'Lobaria pulmonaria (5183) cyanobiont']|uniref:SGNH/GDSL hydrolase family protein n=1 Tax=Nostoc sp. 'Lobaria pulmonaria (5183) cyanobiont' TaxID=1618022 RepID=UPI000CF34F2C|nr:SGNH/GDSL hydrolase family protein [Nostoc sp. 'Lobaria pulmonaria (5183) cyanobiont']AVH69882.1 GDSL family lipase [Nostoc sp. 'Lobaria pulmonaria (5183) cyanobiont']